VRNGRAIRISEKAAFFEYADESKKKLKDFPIDAELLLPRSGMNPIFEHYGLAVLRRFSKSMKG
jgi:hypothetical protein